MFKLRAARFFRLLSVAALTAFALFCVLLLVIRFVLFPRVNDYKDQIVDRLSTALGQPVAIEAIETGWQGWNPRLSIRGFQIHDRGHPTDEPVLDFPRVDLVVSWTSLPLLDLRLKQLSIDRPELAVRRDNLGKLHLAGIEFDPDLPNDDTRVTEWLLRQPSIVISDALLTWTDELRRAPQLVLDHVQFRLEHSLGHHRFGLIGTPPAEMASPLDFRGDVTDASLSDWRVARGRFYVRLDFADIGLWREWIPLPIVVDNGKGALRAWFDFAGGRPTGMVADFQLADVQTRLARDLPQLDLANLAGHLDWKGAPGKRVLTASELTFTTRAGQAFSPTNFNLTLTEDPAGEITGGQVTIDQLEAEPLAALAAHLPLPEGWRRKLVQFAPRGRVSNGKFRWSGTSEVLDTFAASGSLQRVGFAASENIPGFTGVSGTFDLDQLHGSVKIDSHDMKLDAPGLFPEPLIFSNAAGNVTWERRDGQWRVAADEIHFATIPFTGSASGVWTAKAKGPGALELSARLVGANVEEITRNMPLAIGADLRAWLKASIKQGTASDVHINVGGDLSEFPFADNRNGKFLITLKVKDATLKFLPEWPPIEELDADLKFEGARMTIDAARGHSFDARLGPTRAEIANLGAQSPVLTVSGDVTGPTATFLQYIEHSPVEGWIDHASEGVIATGNGKLQLKLTLALGRDHGTKVAGEYQFLANEFRFPELPVLGKVNGRLTFTERDVHTQDLALEALGGPAKLAITNVDGHMQIAGSGTANLAELRNEFKVPLLERLSGSTDWAVNLTSVNNAVSWKLESSMKGAVIDLPQPIGKKAIEVAALKVERHEIAGHPMEDLVTTDYRGIVRAAAHRERVGTGTTADRVLLLLGSAAAGGDMPTQSGVFIRGALPELDLDQWLALYAKERPHMNAGANATHGESGFTLNGVDLDVGKFDVFGRVLHEFKVTTQRAGEDWKMNLHGREVDGTATWRGPSGEFPNGRVMARLTRLVPPGPGELHPVRSEIDPANDAANPWPELDVVSDTFVSKGHDLGKLELVAKPVATDWRIEQLTVSNPEGRIDANGWWRVHGENQQTLLDVVIDVKDAGGYLERFGRGGLVRGAPTKMNGELKWTGAPNDFDYPTLTGNFTTQSGAGQFLKIDPGIGKLLGVLSLQALPRRITLDFHDVFSEGFAFDEIAGDIRIVNGRMHTENLKLAGPAAHVAINGEVDLAQETQQLVVRVQPSLSSGVSAGAAVLFIANPLVGVAVGAGALLAQKMFNNPIDQLFSFEYRVSGPWADPVVEKIRGLAPANSPVAESGNGTTGK